MSFFPNTIACGSMHLSLGQQIFLLTLIFGWPLSALVALGAFPFIVNIKASATFRTAHFIWWLSYASAWLLVWLAMHHELSNVKFPDELVVAYVVSIPVSAIAHLIFLIQFHRGVRHHEDAQIIAE